MNPQTLKDYVAVFDKEENCFHVWSKDDWEEYLAVCKDGNSKPGCKILATFSKDEPLKEGSAELTSLLKEVRLWASEVSKGNVIMNYNILEKIDAALAASLWNDECLPVASAGAWRSAAKPPGITQWYVVKCEQRRFASLIYVDSKITLERVAKDIDVEIDLLEWLDDSAASPAGDGWTPLTSGNPLPDYDEPMLWITESGNQFVQALDKDESIQCFRDATKATHYRPLPSPPNKSV